MGGLPDLATELIQLILNELGDHSQAYRDLCSLRLVCKRLNANAEAKLFSNIIVDPSSHSARVSAAQLEALASGNCSASTFAKTLKIKSLNLWSHSSYRMGAIDDKKWGPAPIVRLHLPRAIMSLKNVRTVSWSIVHDDEKWAINDVMKALSSLPSLADFRLDCSLGGDSPGFVLPLHLLSDLRRITVRGVCDNFRDNIVRPLATAIARSPALSHLDVDSARYWDNGTPSLYHLFVTETCLSLKHLSLRHWRLCSDQVYMPHLKSLTSLVLFTECGFYPMESRHVWKALLAEGIRLKELTADEAHEELLEYISSYSGLQKLRLVGLGVTFTDDIAEKFFCHTLPVHSSTLRSLTLVPSFEGKWCFSEINAGSILGCQKLNDMAVALQWEDHHKYSNELNPVDLLLSSAANLPELRSLHINSAGSNYLRAAKCGNPINSYRNYVNNQIEASMMAFAPIDPDRHVPEVTGPAQVVYRIFPDPHQGGELRYLRKGCGFQLTC